MSMFSVGCGGAVRAVQRSLADRSRYLKKPVLASQATSWPAAAAQVADSRAAAVHTFKPSVHCQPTKFNSALLSLCPSLTAPYSLPMLICNEHMETLVGAVFRQKAQFGTTLVDARLHLARCCCRCNCSCAKTLLSALQSRSTLPSSLPALTQPHLLFDREILHLPDGGCVALDTESVPPELVGSEYFVVCGSGGLGQSK